MKIYKIEFTAIITMHFIALTLSEDLEIFRERADGNNGWKKGTDTFKIPSSLCNHHESNYRNCVRFNANAKSANGQQCLCSCSNENATLMFQNNEWKCLENSLVRDLLVSNRQKYIRFINESKDNELRMLNISDYERVTLPWFWFNCRLNEESSWYIGCDGFEVPFSSKLFTIHRGANHNFPYFLKVNRGVSGAEFLRGRIIKLGFQCTFLNHILTLLFKYEGKLTCPISSPTVQPLVTTKSLNVTSTLSLSTITRTTSYVGNDATTRSPPTMPHIIPTVSDISRTVSVSSTPVSDIPTTTPDTSQTVPNVLSTVSYLTSPTTSDAPMTIFDTSSTVTDVQPTVPDIASETLPMTSDATTGYSSEVPARPSPGSERRTGDNSSSLALIAGITAAVLAVVFIVGFLVYRCRYSKQSPHTSAKCERKKETVMMSSHTSSAYEPDDENAYKELDFREPPIYASHYQVPNRSSESHFTDNDPNADHVYAPLNISEGQNIYGHVNTQEEVYRVLESPTNDNDVKSKIYGHSISIEQPVYYMEELSVEGAEGPAQDGANDNQPVYNVLEEPYPEGSEGPGDYGAISPEEPVYNTLEESYAERPDSEFINEPIYNVLEEGPYPEV